jgi:hypothetical protein
MELKIKKKQKSSVKTRVSTLFTIRLKNIQRFKADVVARDKGRKLSEHIHWLINQSVTNYESRYGEIQITKEEIE